MDRPQMMLSQKIKVLMLQVIWVADLGAVLIILWKPLEEYFEQFNELTQAGHLVFIQIFELEHQRTDMLTEWFKGLQELGHQLSGKEMWIGNQGGTLVLQVMVGKSDAIRDLNAEDKSRWY